MAQTKNTAAKPAAKKKAQPGEMDSPLYLPLPTGKKPTQEQIDAWEKEEREAQERAFHRDMERQKRMLDELLPVVKDFGMQIKNASSAPTLQQCILGAFGSCIRKHSSEANPDDVADRAIALGTALYNKLQG